MRVLSASELGGMARAVGFTGDQLTGSVALALAVSGGHPGFEHAVFPGPSAWYRGLHGVDLCEHPHLLGVDLANPYRATEAAYDLTMEHGGLSWCAAYRAGGHVGHLERAAVGVSMRPAPARESSPTPGPDLVHAANRARERIIAADGAVSTLLLWRSH